MIKTITLNPLDYYTKDNFRHRDGLALDACLMDACGLIPHFLQDDDLTMVGSLNLRYEFGGAGDGKSMAKIDERGVHTYPSDPPQYPYMKIERGEETMWIYPRAFIAIHKADGTWHHARID